jgi:hypothetical protein
VSAWSVQFLISVVFWVWISPKINFQIPPFFNYSAHGGLLLTLCGELPINSVVFLPKDMVYSVAVLLGYQGVNLYFTAIDGPVYPGLNYQGSESVILIGFALSVYLGSYFAGVFLTRSRTLRKVKAP